MEDIKELWETESLQDAIPLLDVNEAQDSQQAFVHRFPAVDYQLPNVWLLDDGHPFRTPSPCEVEWFCTR